MAINPKPKPAHLFSLLLLFSLPILSLSASDAPTVYELLPKYGLPSGLLPDSVKSYSLSSDDGTFVVELDKPCYIQFDYLVYYDKKITGKLKYGSITDLKGIQVQRLFIWFDVDEIKVDLPPSDSIYFLVGFINKKLDVDQFKTVRSCGAKKNRASVPCGRLWKRVIEIEEQFIAHNFMMAKLPTPVDEVEMLITE
ncbi:hypothetical protein RHSIM_Rhsim01G0185400 [Rhododendron simsii]|uniref:Uncharacterized protein n=1 Tax=Rhododendron simsii TaxID=118357 RepID=A0A834HGN5_RHOSS|nr:hypothetical protein RHSIM_Rhsim01G0185400 [Rhododendron simsii]